jgi:hypothetical protein
MRITLTRDGSSGAAAANELWIGLDGRKHWQA